jgi:glycosyltransferase involved in cell wall biosynthesis
VVVVGYLGHLDVLLARALWRGRRIVLDHLVPLGEAVQDRRVSSERVKWLMERLDRAALGAGDVLCVDTQAHLETLPEDARRKAVVVRVGATRSWFIEPVPREDGHLRVIFFGLYTPLQGAPVIGRAIRLLEEEPIRFTMVGTGQDYAHTRELAGSRAAVDWLEWVDMERLPRAVAEHDVCLGIFGVTEKANRVVPNKVYQGAAAGSAIVTADTPPQREILGDAALLVPAGDAAALAAALVRLSQNRAELWRYRLAAHQRAREAFEPSVVARPLRDYLRGEGSELGDDQAATPASEER